MSWPKRISIHSPAALATNDAAVPASCEYCFEVSLVHFGAKWHTDCEVRRQDEVTALAYIVASVTYH
jgi:hypothetical protein